MDSKRIAITICVLTVVVLLGGTFYFTFQGPVEVEQPFVPIFPDDVAMQAAYSKAQDSLDYFLKLASKPPAETQGYAIKARIRENERQELFWLYPFEYNGDTFVGRINDDPEVLKKRFLGDVVEFERRDIVDWTFDDTRVNVMHGNYTGCVELRQQAPENAKQFQAFYGLKCDDNNLGEY